MLQVIDKRVGDEELRVMQSNKQRFGRNKSNEDTIRPTTNQTTTNRTRLHEMRQQKSFESLTFAGMQLSSGRKRSNDETVWECQTQEGRKEMETKSKQTA